MHCLHELETFRRFLDYKPKQFNFWRAKHAFQNNRGGSPIVSRNKVMETLTVTIF